MVDALNQKDVLSQWFSDVKRWGVEDCCDSRKVWLNIVGVPPQGWMWENFKKIAELWGRFVCLGKSTTATNSFEAMKVCIATTIMQKISSEVILSLGSCGYRITISEVELVTQASSLCNKNGILKEVDIVPRFEDIADIDEEEDDNIITGDQVQLGEEEEELANSNSNSKVGEGQETLRSNVSRSGTPSRTRTKTVSFSVIGDSEEVCKDRKQFKNLAAQEFSQGSPTVSQPPPGFGFESPNSLSVDNVQQSIGMTSSRGIVEQDQQEEGLLNFKKGVLQEPTSTNSTEITSESLKQLAYESLQIEELLGVKVIGDYEAAVSRITKPLKKNRGKKRGAGGKRQD